eukprot:COSAG02_NODE_46096_length_351_cov_1.833333_1_plen_58_part_10
MYARNKILERVTSFAKCTIVHFGDANFKTVSHTHAASYGSTTLCCHIYPPLSLAHFCN